MPKKLLVMGSGAIGIEFASFFHTMGAEVTVVEMMDHIMPVEDKEISAFARKTLEKDGMKILTGARVAKLDRGPDHVTAHIEVKGKTEQMGFDRVISAVGVIGNTEGLGLETTRVKVDRNVIEADGYGRTAEKGIYAIGDVAGPPMLAHKAEHEGVICIEKIKGLANVHPMNPDHIPGCTYCHPQVASVGMSEEEAQKRGHKVKVGRFPLSAMVKPWRWGRRRVW